MAVPVKLMMTWNIKPGEEEQYFAFITQEFPLALQEAGFKLTDAWYTVYGDWPQVSMSFMGDGFSALESFLISEQWQELKARLLSYTQDYHQKIIRARGGFQL